MWCRASRILGRAITGQHVMLCAVAYARDWRTFTATMDALAWRLWREAEHCRNRYHHEHD